jgi:hypothetical protein
LEAGLKEAYASYLKRMNSGKLAQERKGFGNYEDQKQFVEEQRLVYLN